MKVLVIDDDRLVRRATVRLLRGLGWTTIEAGSPSEAEGLYEIVDVALSDWDMPEGGGERVMAEAKCPVVVYSASDVLAISRQFGCVVVLKPALADELHAALRKVAPHKCIAGAQR